MEYNTFKINLCGFSRVLLKSVKIVYVYDIAFLMFQKPIRGLHLPVWPIWIMHFMPENGPKWPNKYLKWRAEPIVTISCYWAWLGSAPLSPPLARDWGQESALYSNTSYKEIVGLTLYIKTYILQFFSLEYQLLTQTISAIIKVSCPPVWASAIFYWNPDGHLALIMLIMTLRIPCSRIPSGATWWW